LRVVQARAIKGNFRTIFIKGALTLMAAFPVAIVGAASIKEMFADRKSTESLDETIRYLFTGLSRDR